MASNTMNGDLDGSRNIPVTFAQCEVEVTQGLEATSLNGVRNPPNSL